MRSFAAGLRSGVTLRVQPARGARASLSRSPQMGHVGVPATAGCAGGHLSSWANAVWAGNDPVPSRTAAGRDVPHPHRWLPARTAGARLPAPLCMECGLCRPPSYRTPSFHIHDEKGAERSLLMAPRCLRRPLSSRDFLRSPCCKGPFLSAWPSILRFTLRRLPSSLMVTKCDAV